jgi:hypothetical protein
VAEQGHPGPDRVPSTAAAGRNPRQPGREKQFQDAKDAIPRPQAKDENGDVIEEKHLRPKATTGPLVVQLHDLRRVRLTGRRNEKGALGAPFLWAALLRCALGTSLAKLAPLPKNLIMLRLLFWIAVIAAAVWFWRKFKARRLNSPSELTPPDGALRPLRRAPATRPRAQLTPAVVLHPGTSGTRAEVYSALTRPAGA